MKLVICFTTTILFLQAESLICLTSLCVINKDSEFNCRSTYLAAYVQCGSVDNVCVKSVLFNTTASEKKMESSMSVTRSPLMSVKRNCGKNPLNVSMGCFQPLHASPPYEVHVCLCDSDYCNKQSLTQGSKLLNLILSILIIIYPYVILK